MESGAQTSLGAERGLKSYRRIHLEDSQGIVTWPPVSEYAATLGLEDFQAVLWPTQTGSHTVYVHLLSTRVKKLDACLILIVREDPKDPHSPTASSPPVDCNIRWIK